MKPTRSHHASRSLAAALVAVALAFFGHPAAAKPAELGLRSGGQTCDGKGTYGYTATWHGAPGATFYVNSGNGCTSGGQVCGVSTRTCIARCSKLGACRVELRQCGAAHPGRWSRVTSTDASRQSDQLVAPPPGRCL